MVGGLTSCESDLPKNNVHTVTCAILTPAGFGFCPARITIESEKPIAGIYPKFGTVRFFVVAGGVPQEFINIDLGTRVTATFRLTGDTGHCFGWSPYIEILSIEICNEAPTNTYTR